MRWGSSWQIRAGWIHPPNPEARMVEPTRCPSQNLMLTVMALKLGKNLVAFRPEKKKDPNQLVKKCHRKPCLFSPKSHGCLAQKWWISGTPKALTLPGGSWQSLVAKRPWYLAGNSGSTYDIYHQIKYFPSYTSKIFENRNSVLSRWFHAGSYFSILWSRGGFKSAIAIAPRH